MSSSRKRKVVKTTIVVKSAKQLNYKLPKDGYLSSWQKEPQFKDDDEDEDVELAQQLNKEK